MAILAIAVSAHPFTLSLYVMGSDSNGVAIIVLSHLLSLPPFVTRAHSHNAASVVTTDVVA
jgi:hypothetical protein